MKKKYYKDIDIIRVIACLSILLYHVGVLTGGYLAVCTFFVLSGYLGVISVIKKKKISLKEYYLTRLKRIYIPLLVTVFISIGIISLIPSINWINLKPETTSVLLGYNNYWQLNANLDYFVRHINSPFIHLWYIAILLQFEIIFPLFFILLRKLGKKTKIFPCLLLVTISILSYIYFCISVKNGNIMYAYYGTLTRLFSLTFGMLLGFIHTYYGKIVIRLNNMNKKIFITYIIILLIIFVIVEAKSKLFSISMLITTLISMRLIDYGTISLRYKKNILTNIIKELSNISYEVYLVQYPVIFLLQNIKISLIIKVPIILIITLIISYIINKAISIKSLKKENILKIALCILISIMSLFGFYKYVTTKDYTKEMKQLEKDLSANRSLIEKKQKVFLRNQAKQEKNWQKDINELENDKKNIDDEVKNLKVVGVGDSVMELAIKDLYNKFPNGYFDAKVNRTEKQAIDVIKDIKKKGILGDILILNIGTNGSCNENCKTELMETIGDRRVFWVNATNPDYDTFNPSLKETADRYHNIRIVDWISVVEKHPEYVINDKVHPTITGCKIYTDTVYKAIYNDQIKEINNNKEEKIKEHKEQEKNKITFIGNDILLGIYTSLSKHYKNKEIIIDKFTYKTLKERLEKEDLSNNIVFVFDNSLSLSNREYQKIIDVYKDKNIYIINTSKNLKVNNSKVINFNTKKDGITKIDGIHLTKTGNKELYKTIEKNIKEK